MPYVYVFVKSKLYRMTDVVDFSLVLVTPIPIASLVTCAHYNCHSHDLLLTFLAAQSSET
jgi:hypothetical protein